MKTITYSLKNGAKTSDRCYSDIETFAEAYSIKTESLREEVERFVANVDKPRSFEEYALELLTLGVLFNEHAAKAERLSPIAASALKSLVEMRQNGGVAKQYIDAIRGIGTGMFLANDGVMRVDISISSIERLISWMEASGEYNQEAKRLRLWLPYLKKMPVEEFRALMDKVNTLTCWFKTESQKALGQYTTNVESFIKTELKKHAWKEDLILCGKKPVEYHLNMVGAEIMNRAFRKEFNETKHKVVILPSCMRLKHGNECKAEYDSMSMTCTGCNAACRVNQIMELGNKHGFSVRVVSHESAVFNGDAAKKMLDMNTGIIGVTCVSGLMSGGWKAMSMGMPPQCVYTDCVGCKKHWADREMPNDISMNRLKTILEINNEPVKTTI